MDAIAVTEWRCSMCRKGYDDLELAERCCLCETCGKSEATCIGLAAKCNRCKLDTLIEARKKLKSKP